MLEPPLAYRPPGVRGREPLILFCMPPFYRVRGFIQPSFCTSYSEERRVVVNHERLDSRRGEQKITYLEHLNWPFKKLRLSSAPVDREFMSTAEPPHRDTLEESLRLTKLKVEGEGTTLGELMEVLGTARFTFISLLLSVPFIQPMSLGPINVLGGLAFAVLGWAMMRADSNFKLPAKFATYRLQGKFWFITLDWTGKTLAFCRKFTRKRLVGWCRGPQGERLVGLFILLGGLILAIPLLNIPFNNTFPALMVFCAALAWLEEDGLWMLFSAIWGVISLAYCGIVIWVLVTGSTWLIDKVAN